MASAEHPALISVVAVSINTAGQVRQVDLLLPTGASVRDALLLSGLKLPVELAESAALKVGVWGQLRSLDHVLRDRDRVELYRALQIDPKEARRLRHREQRRSQR